MSKTTKELREFVRDSYIPESIAIRLLDDLEAAEAELEGLREQTQKLPPLPVGWHGPWHSLGTFVLDKNRVPRIKCADVHEAKLLADLLNVTHPGPAKD